MSELKKFLMIFVNSTCDKFSTYIASSILFLVGINTSSGQGEFRVAPPGPSPAHLEPLYGFSESILKRIEELAKFRNTLAWAVSEDSFGKIIILSLEVKSYPEISLPSLDKEEGVKDDSSCSIVIRKFSKGLPAGGYELESDVRIEITKELAILWHDLWVSWILDARFPKNSYRGVGGINYYMGAWYKGVGELMAETWSPTDKNVIKIIDVVKLLVGVGGDKEKADEALKVMRELKSQL